VYFYRSRKKKESKKKSRSRKRSRQQNWAEQVLHLLIPGTTLEDMEEVSPLCEGNVQALLKMTKVALQKGVDYLANHGVFCLSLGKQIHDLLKKHHKIDWEWFNDPGFDEKSAEK